MIGATHENYVISKYEKKMRMTQLEQNKRVLDSSIFDESKPNLISHEGSLRDSPEKSILSEHE